MFIIKNGALELVMKWDGKRWRKCRVATCDQCGDTYYLRFDNWPKEKIEARETLSYTCKSCTGKFTVSKLRRVR